MTSRKAAMIANQIHAAREAGQIGIFDALKLLSKIEEHLSETQLRKVEDLAYEARHNAHMYDENGFRC